MVAGYFFLARLPDCMRLFDFAAHKSQQSCAAFFVISFFAFTREEGGVSNQFTVPNPDRAIQSGSRASSALIGIYEISKVLTRPARLEMALS